MKENKKELLMTYIKANIAPILVDFIEGKDIPQSILLPANCKLTELNGHYENQDFIPPEWLNKLINKQKPSILIIDKIDTISKEEQTKFIEILKYKQVSTFKLPQNTIIILTAKEINKNKINEEIYSLVAHIKE